METINCKFCGKETAAHQTSHKERKRLFCGRACFNKWSATQRENRIITSRGYVQLWINGKYLFEHRVIMERTLGRPLLKNEAVHHINGDKTDNRTENLRLMPLHEHNRLPKGKWKPILITCPCCATKLRVNPQNSVRVRTVDIV